MAVDPQRLREELQRMEQLVRDDPNVLARFDKNGDGILDGREWEEVRQLVIRRLEREAAEAFTAAITTQDLDLPDLDEPTYDSGSVAEGIYLRDLTPRPTPLRARTLADHDEIVIQRQAGLGQLYASSGGLTYAAYSREESPLASAEHTEGRLLIGVTDISPGQEQGAVFAAKDISANRTWRLVQVIRDRHMGFSIGTDSAEQAWVRQNYEPVGVSYTVGPAGQGEGTVHIRQRLLQPFTYDIQLGGRISGVLERGWSGLGTFLSGHDQVYLSLTEHKLAAPIVWGLVCVMIQVDLQAAAGRR